MKILLVIDMQKDFVSGSLGTKEAIEIVPNVVSKIRNNKNNLIIATYDTHDENYLETLEGKKLPVTHCVYKTDGWQLNEDVENALRECSRVDKKTKVTFGYVDWIRTFKALGVNLENIDEIEICGLCTDICVISNALILRALFPNTIITIDSSCCAGVTPETHEAALATMKMCQIDVM